MTRRIHTPRFTCTSDVGVDLSRVFENALTTLDSNVVPRRHGGEPEFFLRAGGGYTEPWTRDAAINAWQAASLLLPQVARDTLLMVCEPDLSVVVQDDQWWDQVIWIVGAWHHVLITGDVEFLEIACRISAATLARADKRRDPRTGLYRGPAVMQDGISGYPDLVVSPEHAADSFVLSHPVSHEIMCLSTNALHVLALEACGAMHEAAGRDPSPWRERSGALEAAIRATLWSAERAAYAHLALWRDEELWLDWSQETLGWALSILAGLGDAAEWHALAANLHREPMGVVNVWPHLQDFSDDRPGRHNAMCWPMVMGIWAQALGRAHATEDLGRAVMDMAYLIQQSSGRHDEVYNALTGEPDGGWQVGRHWRSEPDQTWSATTFIGSVLYGLVGMRLSVEGLRFEPAVAAQFGSIGLHGLPYRGSVLTIHTRGHGSLERVHVNGLDVTARGVHVSSDAQGELTIDLILASEAL